MPTPAYSHVRAAQHGFREIDRSGMVYNPLANSWRLCEGDLRTNYILAARKVR